MEVKVNTITFDGNSHGLEEMWYEGITKEASWHCKLIIKKNNQFVFHFQVMARIDYREKSWDETPVDDWVYEGTFTAIYEKDMYYLTFTNISRSGTSKPNRLSESEPNQIPKELFEIVMKAEIETDGGCEFIHNGHYIDMKGKENIKAFFDQNYANMEHLKTMYITNPIEYGSLTLNPDGTLEYRFENVQNNDTFNWNSSFTYKGTWTYDASSRVIKLSYNSFKVINDEKELTQEELMNFNFPKTVETEEFVFGKKILTLYPEWNYDTFNSYSIRESIKSFRHS